MLMPLVSRYMTPNPHAVASHAKMSSARELMARHKIRHLPVVDDRELVGILSDRDLLATHVTDDSVAGAMTRDVAAVREEASIDEVITLMEAGRFSSVVVFGESGVAGIFTLTDAMRAFGDVLRRNEGDQ